MKLSSDMKDVIIGVPVVVFVIVTLFFLVNTFGAGSLLILFLLFVLGAIGSLVGEAIRDKFRVWK